VLLTIIAVKPNVGKTEILFLLCLRYHPELPVFTFQGQAIVSRHVIKYLGVYIDSKFTFLPHCKYLETKCLKIINALKVLFANKYGYSNKSRKQMLNGTAGAIIKYGSTIFSHTLQKRNNKAIIRKIHRQMLILSCRSYRTVSYLALCAINNWPPMEYEVHARTILYLHLRDIPYTLNTPHYILSRWILQAKSP